MECKFCNRDRKLVKAHVIPEAFFRELRPDSRAPRMLSNIPGVHPKKTPIGVYDKELLCRECEDKFQAWDNYGISVLLNEFSKFEGISDGTEIVAYFKRKFDYKLLKLFFISLLWRASVSKQQFYSKVNLGSFEPIAKQMLESDNPGSEEEFSTLLSIFVSRKGMHRLAKTMLDPYMEKWEGVNAYRFYLAGYCAYIKVDKRPLPIALRKMVMRSNCELYVVTRDLEKSNDVKAMVAVVMGGATLKPNKALVGKRHRCAARAPQLNR